MTRLRLPRLILWGVLALSLMLNAVGLGLLWRLHALRDTLEAEAPGLFSASHDNKGALRDAILAHRIEFEALLKQLGQARQAVHDARTARPYDHAAVAAAMQTVREATTALQLKAQMVLLAEFDQQAAGS